MKTSRIDDILKPAGEAEHAARERRVRDQFWRTLRRAARQVPFMDEVAAGYFAALDPKTPMRVRGTLIAALAYFVMPADVIPDFIVGLGLDRIGFLIVVMVAYLILGMFMDPLAILLLTIPILQPTIVALDIDLLWFGVFAVIMGELAILTPPVGVLTFIMHGLAQDKAVNLGHAISLKDVFQSVGMFLPTVLLLVILLILFPEAVTWLPSLME